MPFKVKDESLAKQGALNIEWAESQMGSLLEIRKRFEKEKPLKGLTIGMALHVTKETAALVRTLAKAGTNVFAHKGESKQEYYEFLNKVLDSKPDVTIDDGCDLISEIHKNRTNLLDELKVGTEETTTGVIRLKAMEKDGALKYPIIAVNDSKTKHLFDNYNNRVL